MLVYYLTNMTCAFTISSYEAKVLGVITFRRKCVVNKYTNLDTSRLVSTGPLHIPNYAFGLISYIADLFTSQ